LVHLQVKSLRSGKILEEGQQLLGYKGWESSTVLLSHAHLYARNPTPTAAKKNLPENRQCLSNQKVANLFA